MRRKALSYLHFFAPCPAKLVCFAPAGQPKEYHGQVTAPRPAKRKILNKSLSALRPCRAAQENKEVKKPAPSGNNHSGGKSDAKVKL